MRKGFLLVFSVVLLSSCLKREDFPNRPDIEYLGHEMVSYQTDLADSLGYVIFGFTDGDGDLGLNPSDTFGDFAPGQMYNYNLFVRYFQKDGGVFEVVQTPGSLNGRFENLTPYSSDGTLKGEMAVGVYDGGFEPNDTVKFEMFIVDRALNHSDTILTPEIIIEH